MLLMIEGQERAFIPIKTFRDAYGLPLNFGINLFASKDYNGLGSVINASTALHTLRSSVLEAVPESG